MDSMFKGLFGGSNERNDTKKGGHVLGGEAAESTPDDPRAAALSAALARNNAWDKKMGTTRVANAQKAKQARLSEI
jgi:hypothetical protein